MSLFFPQFITKTFYSKNLVTSPLITYTYVNSIFTIIMRIGILIDIYHARQIVLIEFSKLDSEVEGTKQG